MEYRIKWPIRGCAWGARPILSAEVLIMKRIILSVLVLGAAIGGLAFWYSRHSKANEASYRTEDVKRGRLVVTVSSTGTLEPEDVIDVGTQVAGMIRKFGVGTDGNRAQVNYWYTVTYDDEQGKKKTFLVGLVMDRKPTQNPDMNPWRVQDFMGPINPNKR